MSASGKLQCSIEPHTQRPVWAVPSYKISDRQRHAAPTPMAAMSPSSSFHFFSVFARILEIAESARIMALPSPGKTDHCGLVQRKAG